MKVSASKEMAHSLFQIWKSFNGFLDIVLIGCHGNLFPKGQVISPFAAGLHFLFITGRKLVSLERRQSGQQC